MKSERHGRLDSISLDEFVADRVAEGERASGSTTSSRSASILASEWSRQQISASSAQWRTVVRGNLVVERDLVRHTIFLAWKDPPPAYAALSLTEEITDLLPMPPPMMVEAVLLPCRQLADAYRGAKARGIITTLASHPSPGAVAWRPVAPGAEKTRRRSLDRRRVSSE